MANPERRKLWRWAAIAAAVVLAAGLLAAWVAIRPYGEVGSTYLAKQLCSCVFLTGRSDSSCRADFGADINKFDVRIDHANRTVSTRLLLFGSRAAFDRGYGCRVVR
jgi:hypothetical protein